MAEGPITLPFLVRFLPFWQYICHFWQDSWHLWQHILPFLAICTDNFWISQGIEDIRGFHRVSQGFERRVGLPPFVGGLRLRGFASLESRVCRLEHLLYMVCGVIFTVHMVPKYIGCRSVIATPLRGRHAPLRLALARIRTHPG